MKRLGTLLAGAGLIAPSGAVFSAQANNNREGAALFTPSIQATDFHCNAVNVSRKPLLIAMSIIDGEGNVLSPVPVPNPRTPPGVNALNDIEPAPDTEAYCKVQVLGTDDPNTSEWS